MKENSKVNAIDKGSLLTIRDLIQERAGLFFSGEKFNHVKELVDADYNRSPFPTVREYIKHLHTPQGEGLLRDIISALTPNETFFFREKSHFNILEKHILPEIISRESAGTRSISIWSAGCSTGEEPYSLAIVLSETIPQITTWNIRLIATDIDKEALEAGRKGEYGEWSFRGVLPGVKTKHFQKKGDVYKIKEEYRSLVRFVEHNIMSELAPDLGNLDKKFDVIICRNVMIYFQQETIRRLILKFHYALRPGGYLIVGHAEYSADNYSCFTSRCFPDAVIYQKEEEARTLPGQITLNSLTVTQSILKKKVKARNSHLRLIEKKASQKFPAKPKNPRAGEKRRDQDSEETVIFEEALKYYKEKRYELAVDRFSRIMRVNSGNVRACWMLSHIAANRGYFEEALEWGNRCVELDPLFKDSYYTLSLTHMARGDLKEAEKEIRKAIYIDGEFSLGYFMLGNIYLLMHLPEQARRYFETAGDILSKRSRSELVSQTDNLTVGDLLKMLELKSRAA